MPGSRLLSRKMFVRHFIAVAHILQLGEIHTQFALADFFVFW